MILLCLIDIILSSLSLSMYIDYVSTLNLFWIYLNCFQPILVYSSLFKSIYSFSFYHFPILLSILIYLCLFFSFIIYSYLFLSNLIYPYRFLSSPSIYLYHGRTPVTVNHWLKPSSQSAAFCCLLQAMPRRALIHSNLP